MAIVSSGVQVELREVVLRNKPAHMLEISPKGTVPVLQLPDGSVIEESRDIMDWALNQSDPDHWLPDANAADALETFNSWVAENDGSFKTDLDHYKYSVRFPEQSMEDYRKQGEVFLQRLEDNLAKQGCLMGERISIADMSVLPFVRQFAFVDKDWFDRSPYVHVQAWLQRFLDSGLFARAMLKVSPWEPGQAPVVFPVLQ